jgi:hypothetical protein
MIININTNKRKFFRQALEIIKTLSPINRLRNKELDVLAELLYFNDKYSNIPQELRWKIVFDYDTKMEIIKYLNIKDTDMYNILTSLRNKGVLKGRTVEHTFGLTSDNPNIRFNFNLGSNDSAEDSTD